MKSSPHNVWPAFNCILLLYQNSLLIIKIGYFLLYYMIYTGVLLFILNGYI